MVVEASLANSVVVLVWLEVALSSSVDSVDVDCDGNVSSSLTSCVVLESSLVALVVVST